MQIKYHPRHNVAYIYLQDRPTTVNTVELSENLLMDVGEDGTVYGLELLNAREQLRTGALRELEVENEESGKKTRVSLPF